MNAAPPLSCMMIDEVADFTPERLLSLIQGKPTLFPGRSILRLHQITRTSLFTLVLAYNHR